MTGQMDRFLMDCQLPEILAAFDAPTRMVQPLINATLKRRAELIDEKGVVVATFNETCHD